MAKAKAAKAKVVQFKCDTCGDIDYVLIDGYFVGDRMLEGVMFIVRSTPKGLVAETQPDDKSYMSDLNEKKWLKKVAEAAADEDSAQCPKCSAQIDGPEVYLREQ